ncbi:MAG: hypothetical protein QJR03_05760 [Sphaerobacter sp.]|nr:hypothetical protein [Sphaerobacter sp.]
MRRRHMAVIGAAVVLLGLVMLARPDRGAGRDAVRPDPGVPATAEQVAAFEALLRREERAMFNMLVYGDMHEFPTIYYNDPTVELPESFDWVVRRVGMEAIGAALAGLAPGPRGAETGILSARVALGIERQRQLDAWKQAQAKAAAEGRHPTAADLPEGVEPPANPLSPTEWVDVQFDVFDVSIQGDLATAKLAYGSRTQSEVIDVYTFTRVDEQWYISGVETIRNPYALAPLPTRHLPTR